MELGEEREVRKEGDVGGQPPKTAGGGVDKQGVPRRSKEDPMRCEEEKIIARMSK